jgi:UDP-N-acetylmuramoyl-tripeptide--D-alanyl-D-alanine ligase
MIKMFLSEVADVLCGELVKRKNSQAKDSVISNIIIDSRILVKDGLFVALRGHNFNGHSFCENAVALGCCGLLVEEYQENCNIPQIVVKDTRVALGLISAYVKKKANVKTVAITGSSGKTTVKEMISSILSKLGNVLATSGNLNNDIGVPLTLLRLSEAHDFAVIELGANHLGEIDYTSNLVKPDVAIINNISEAHLEGFGSLEGVSEAKGEIFNHLLSQGVAIYECDSIYSLGWNNKLSDKQIKTFSNKNSSSTCYASDVSLNDDGCSKFLLNTSIGKKEITLNVVGEHNVSNAIVAATAALEFGASLDDIEFGLMDMLAVKGRLNVHQISDTLKVIDDTYNANVGSTKVAIDLLATCHGLKILVLGDMGELGESAKEHHEEIGKYAYNNGIDIILTYGVLSKNVIHIYDELSLKDLGCMYPYGNLAFNDKYHLIKYLSEKIKLEVDFVNILVKGSRSMHMEDVVKKIIS